MEKQIIKRKISKSISVKARYISNLEAKALIRHMKKLPCENNEDEEISLENKFQVSPFVQVKPKKAKKKREKKNKEHGTVGEVGSFALAVIKVPWYKKLKRAIFRRIWVLCLKNNRLKLILGDCFFCIHYTNFGNDLYNNCF